jgi:CDP-glycerol glycerophosphotransferase
MAAMPQDPTVSVVVPVYNVEAYLADCLESILVQELDDIEVLLVDDGSPDGSRAIAERYVAQDDRLRLLTRENGGLGAARNTGLREARGEFLSFVDSDDELPGDALGVLVRSARETGADIVCGSVERFDSAKAWPAKWAGPIHSRRRAGITLEEFPRLVRNLYTPDKLFRRDFFTAQDLWFREGVSYEDQPIVIQLLARARSIDVLPDVVYRYRQRDDRSSLSQQTATVRDLRDRILAWELSREVLGAELSREGYDTWRQTLFEAHFRWYLTSPGTEDDTYWNLLERAVRELSADVPDWVWEATPPPQRLLVRLAQLGRRADLQEFVRAGGMRLGRWPTREHPDGVLVELPLLGDPELPDSLFVMGAEQLPRAGARKRRGPRRTSS